MRRRRVTVAALVAVTAAAGCGDDSSKPSASTDVKPVGTESAGSVVQFADCGDWRAGSEAERNATVKTLRGQLTPQRSTTAASPLPDERAYAMFQKTCAPDSAASLRLYKLYVRMQGFAPLMD
jgi:hypothetical protein